MCKYTIITHSCCGNISSIHECCTMKKGVEFPHFLRCDVVEESRLSDTQCKQCLQVKAGADPMTPKPKAGKKTPFLGGSHGWNLRKLIPRSRENQGEVKEEGNRKGNTKPVISKPMSMVKIPEEYVMPEKYVVQLTSDKKDSVHPLREHPLRELQVQRKPVPSIIITSADNNQEGELCVDDRSPTEASSKFAESDTKSNLCHKTSTRSQYRGSVAFAQSSELSFDYRPSPTTIASKAEQDTLQILSREPRKPPSPLTVGGFIPELRSYVPYSPAVNNSKLAAYLNENATRPQSHQAFITANAEALFSRRCRDRYASLQAGTVATLQEVESTSSLESGTEQIPSCLVAGSRKQPRLLKRQNSFDAVNSTQTPEHINICRPMVQKSQKVANLKATGVASSPSLADLAATTAPSISPSTLPYAKTATQLCSTCGSSLTPSCEASEPTAPCAPYPLTVRKRMSPLNNSGHIQT